MGTSTRLVISATGFPADNDTWRFLQSSYREPLGALANLAGHLVIISGMSQFGLPGGSYAVQNGFVSYNGEILPFRQSNLPLTVNPQVSVIEETINVNYDADIDNDGQQDNLPAYKTKYLKFGAADGNGIVIGTFPYNQLTRLTTIKELSAFQLPANLVQDANYVHTDNNFTAALLAKLNGIAADAEVNVQADWNQANASHDAFIKNKPTNLMTVLRKGDVFIGDIFYGNSSFNCTFPNIGTSSYIVLGSLEQVSGGDVNATWAIGAKTASYFTINLSEPYNAGQSLRFRFILTPMYTN